MAIFAVGLDSKEKMARQRQLLNCKLGLDVAANFGMDTSSLFSNDDLISNMEKPECVDRVCRDLKVCVVIFLRFC